MINTIVIGMDYAWNGWLEKNYPKTKSFHIRRKRGTFLYYKIDYSTDIDVIRLIRIK